MQSEIGSDFWEEAWDSCRMTGSFENLFFFFFISVLLQFSLELHPVKCKAVNSRKSPESQSAQVCSLHLPYWLKICVNILACGLIFFRSFITDKWQRHIEQKSKVLFYFDRDFVFLKGRKSKPVQGRLMSTTIWYCPHAGFRAVMDDVQQKCLSGAVLVAFHHHCAHIAHRAARCNATVSRLDLKWKQKTHFRHGVRWIQDSFEANIASKWILLTESSRPHKAKTESHLIVVSESVHCQNGYIMHTQALLHTFF